MPSLPEAARFGRPPIHQFCTFWGRERMGKGGRTMAREREREGGQERKSERRKKTPKNKNQMHKSQWQDLLKPRSKFFFSFFFPLRMTKESPHLFQLPLILEPIKGLSGEAIKTATAPKQEQSLVQIPWRKWMSFLATDRLNGTKNKSEQSDLHLEFIQHCIMASALMFNLIGFITLVSPTEKSQGPVPGEMSEIQTQMASAVHTYLQ